MATAPLSGEGHINLSPKGLDTFAIVDPNTIAYPDLTGSDVETVSPRITTQASGPNCPPGSNARARRASPPTRPSTTPGALTDCQEWTQVDRMRQHVLHCALGRYEVC